MAEKPERKQPVVEIDAESGFCFGVVNAIRKAEKELDAGGTLYCLGDIVHNAAEVDRLRRKGLITITHAEFEKLHGVKVLLRAHGEPPSTYEIANRNNIEIIDATCPVVLQLQRRIKESAAQCNSRIVIYGKPGHAEVNGLVGQTGGKAIVVSDTAGLEGVDLEGDVRLYSQTTKPLSGFREMVNEIERRKFETTGSFQWFDTICRQVANRMDKMRSFAAGHDVVVFVSGAKSSNGRVLYAECQAVNPHSYLVEGPESLNADWFREAQSVGICGATSTPAWLMNDVARAVEKCLDDDPDNSTKTRLARNKTL